MYLICSTEENSNIIIEQFKNIGIEAKKLIIVKFIVFDNRLKLILETINSYDYILITSSTIIKYLSSVIKISQNPIFLTVGKTSADKILNINPQIVIYPNINSGIHSLCEEKLLNVDFFNKRLLIIEGSTSNNYIKQFLKYIPMDISSVIVYQTIYEEINKNFINYKFDDASNGIIVTSGGLVDWLFTKTKINFDKNKLINTNFYTIHKNISDKLINYGVKNVFVTKDSQVNQIVDLIKSTDGLCDKI